MPVDLEPLDPENICCHCNEYFTGEGFVTADNDLLCEPCAEKARAAGVEFDEDGGLVNGVTPTDVPPGA